MHIRFDRIATLHAVRPFHLLLPARSVAIPILMYHSISDEEQPNLHPYYRTTASRAVFYEQMRALHQNHYQTCSLGEAVAALQAGDPQATKRVAITFDDGFRDFYRNAFPVLTEFNFTASMFLPTSFIGEQTRLFKGQPCLTWHEVKELQRNGISFGSHTVSHPQLHAVTRTQLWEELSRSKTEIEEKTGQAVDTFAYPYAFPQADKPFRKIVRESLDAAGYKQGVCTMLGRADAASDPFFLERLPVNGDDDPSLFEAKLEGAYDWMSGLQYTAQFLKGIRIRYRG